MERLTHDTIYTFNNHLEDIESKWIVEVQKKLRDYEDAEENGMLIHLPCRVGDTVYLIGSDGKIREGICKSIQIDENNNMVFIEGKDFAFWRKFERFGKTVFLTREEAEQALKQMGE